MQNVDRLINFFTPQHYQLSLQIDRANRSFSGIVTIQGTSQNEQILRLHAKDLTIESVIFDGKAASFRQLTAGELEINHPDLALGKHIIVIAFNGKINETMHGLYPCYYEHEGLKKELLATQFESHHAREVFPCVDEPEAKATFDITLTTENNVTVLGNMPVKTQQTEDDKLITTFSTTPRMSTYLLAWVIGELHRKTATTQSGVEVNIWATPAQSPDSLDFALNMATRTIDFFNDYFGVPYPLPKSDHVALPDFSAGAMENWGLITYREVALLADPATSGISSKQYIALVVAHELSHQWFGNLVTMKWWNNLWLNESFATLMEYIAVDALYPEWNIWLDFSNTESILALRRDSLDGVQPVQVEVHHPDEIATLFDGAIVYAKGARLLRMLQQYIGHDAFQSGLKAYFETYAYQNTEGDDLWNALDGASGKDIPTLMTTWITQPGYPIVEVTQINGSLTLSQTQFFIGTHQPSNQLWPIPLNASSRELPELLDTPQLTFDHSDDTLIRLNVGDSAHFITKYQEPLWSKLVTNIHQLSPLDRLQFLHEQTLLARGGQISTAALVPLLIAYKNETHQAVWDIIALAAGELRKFVEGNDAGETKLRELHHLLAAAQYKRLGWQTKKDESETDSKLRAIIISMMVYAQDQDAIAQALKLYKSTKLEDLDAELRPLILGVVVKYGDDKAAADHLLDIYKTSPLADLREDIASGLTSTNKVSDIEKLLTCLKDNTIIRPQDVHRWFIWTIQNRYGRELAWQWLRNNWDWIKVTFDGGMNYDDFPRYAALSLLTRQQLNEYRDFFTPYQHEPALTRVITLGLNEIEARVNLIEQQSASVQNALAKL